MKKIIYVLVLLAGIEGQLRAQEIRIGLNTQRKFDLSKDLFSRRFQIDLGKGNKLQIELKEMSDLNRIKNMDSLLRIFLRDMEALKDSFSDELTSKRIDYVMDSTGRKEIRFQQFKSNGSNFLVSRGELAALKLEQDTVNFIGMVSFEAKYTLRKAFPDHRYFQVSFFVNQLNELPAILAAGLNDRISTLGENFNSRWNTKQNGRVTLVKDPGISARFPGGYFTGHGDYLSPDITINLQNYKNYFVPAFSLGLKIVISNAQFKREIGIHWEPHFLFQSNQGKLKTFRNDFLSISWGQGMIRDNDPLKESTFLFVCSLGYLIHREGDYYDPHTIRFGAGQLSIFEGKTKIEPLLYFHDFFRGVTPGLRWIQSF